MRAAPREEHKHTELYDDLPKVIRMPTPAEETSVAVASLIGGVTSKPVLLHIRNALQEEPDNPEDGSHDVPRSPETRLIELRNIGRVEDSDWQGDSPDPYHLENPKAQEREELVSLIVKAVILSGLNDPKEQESGEAGAPYHEED